MKIGSAVIQNRKIQVHKENHFEAFYKGRKIYVSSDHGFGPAFEKGLTRYHIAVWEWESAIHDYNGYIDLPDLNSAIKEALEGSCLMPKRISHE